MKVTTLDIAKKAGVSQTTVSLVLNNAPKAGISPRTRQLVLDTARELGYRFQKRRQKEQPVMIGLLVPTLSNLYYPLLVQNIEKYAARLELRIVVQNTLRSPEKEQTCFEVFRAIGVRGVLCLYTPKSPPSDIPVVIVGEAAPETEADVVSLNCFEAGRLLAQHLLELGYRDIAYLSTPFSNITHARQKRLEGIRAAMEQAGCPDRLFVLADTDEDESADIAYETQCGQRLTRQLLQQHPDCRAIIAVNDMTAYGCLGALEEKGLQAGRDIALCAFDNLPLDEVLHPSLTSVDQMAFHGCQMALSILWQRLQDPTARQQQLHLQYKPRLFIRSSTGAGGKIPG